MVARSCLQTNIIAHHLILFNEQRILFTQRFQNICYNLDPKNVCGKNPQFGNRLRMSNQVESELLSAHARVFEVSGILISRWNEQE